MLGSAAFSYAPRQAAYLKTGALPYPPLRIVGFHPPACILALGLPEETQAARKVLIA
jgi:hypothetical protein